jgi:hypothetical protein
VSDDAVRAALESRDFDAAWPLVGRVRDMKLRSALDTFVREGLTRLAPTELEARWPTAIPAAMRLLVAELDRRLRAPHADDARTLLARLRAARPNDDTLQRLAINTDAAEDDELVRALADRSLGRTAAFALVRRGAFATLEQLARTRGALNEYRIHDVVEACRTRSQAARWAVRLALSLDDPRWLAPVLQHLEVEGEVVEAALRREDSRIWEYAMRHAGRVRDPFTLLLRGVRHAKVEVRRAALRAALVAPDPRLLPDVLALRDDPDEWDERYNPEPVSELARRFVAAVGG